MICDIIPEDIQNLVVSTWAENISDAELEAVLPPRFVRDALLAEKGMKAPLTESQEAIARDWCRLQQDAQTEAMKVSDALQKTEPLTQEMAMRGELPAWSIKPWAVTLMFDWSDQLADAVVEAKMYLANR